MNNQNKNIDTNGGYKPEDAVWHAYSPKLCLAIMEFFSKEIPIIDLGCGLNNYISIMNSLGYNGIGVDKLDLGSRHFIQGDLSKPIQLKGKHNVISFEVGEHLPSEYANSYLDNLTSFNGDIIMSWAIPGQAGIGHINCQSNEWVIEQMAKRGYKYNVVKSHQLRVAVSDCKCDWFVNTLMYFEHE